MSIQLASTVLILGARAPVARDWARKFQSAHWAVHVADSISCRLSGYSKGLAGCHRISSPRFAPKKFVKDLLALIHLHRIEWIVPTCEEVFYLSLYKDQLPSHVHVWVDDFAKLKAMHSKWTFLELAKESGMTIPKSHLVTSLEQVRLHFGLRPVALKPEFSRFAVFVRLYPFGLPDDEPNLEDQGHWVAQEFVSGRELCSYSIAYQGRLTAHVCYQPSYRLQQSSSYYFESLAHDVIQQHVAQFVRDNQFTGQISFDWIESVAGEVTVLECNPRATSGLHLFVDREDIVHAAMGCLDFCLTPQSQRPNAFAMIAPLMLTDGLIKSIHQNRFGAWRKDFQRAQDVITRPGDRLNWLGAALDLGAFANLAWRQECGFREASTRDIEWDGEDLF